MNTPPSLNDKFTPLSMHNKSFLKRNRLKLFG